MLDKLLTLPQYVVPHHLLSRLVGFAAASENEKLKNLIITQFAKTYDVDMSEAANEDLTSYASFNDFFTRALKENARPIDTNNTSVISPADGAVSQFGYLQNDRIIQAKGHKYSVVELLGGSVDRAAPFINGAFATIYLSPRDYHRVHMPFGGQLKEMIYVPGELFSVNQRTAENVSNLFARNERMVAIFQTDIGPMALIMVGAMIVAGIETVWSGRITPPGGDLRVRSYAQENIHMAKGDEAGRFFLGSTAIVLFPDRTIAWKGLQPGDSVRMGEAIGEIRT